MTQRRIYQNEFPYFITFRIREGFDLFKDIKYAKLMSKVILRTCKIKYYDVLSYQIMPDHIHILVYNIHFKRNPLWLRSSGRVARSPTFQINAGTAARVRGRCFNVSDLMHGIKSFYCDQIRDQYNINIPIFQPRFYTRIVNTRLYLNTVIEYMKYNPIKAKLLIKYNKLPYQYLNFSKIKKLL